VQTSSVQALASAHSAAPLQQSGKPLLTQVSSVQLSVVQGSPSSQAPADVQQLGIGS
jgi:hypothetical protein